MSYGDLIQAYFGRSEALQGYWTLYVLVIGGVVGFSTFRRRPELATTVLVALLYGCFAYKNLGAIVDAAEEREAIRLALRAYPAAGAGAADVQRVRDTLEPKFAEYDIAGARRFHVACDLLTLGFLAVKEWRRRRPEARPAAG